MIRQLSSLVDDQQALAKIHGAKVYACRQGNQLTLELQISCLIKSFWLHSLDFILVHDNGSTIKCHGDFLDLGTLPCRFTLTPCDSAVDLNEYFQVKQNNYYLAVGKVVIVTEKQNQKTLTNETSLKAFRECNRDSEPDEQMLDVRKLAP